MFLSVPCLFLMMSLSVPVPCMGIGAVYLYWCHVLVLFVKRHVSVRAAQPDGVEKGFDGGQGT